MSIARKNAIKLVLAVVLISFAALWGWSTWHDATAVGEESARTYFFDQSEKKLYAVPHDTIAPDAGIGGPSGDGVRAVVIAWKSERGDPAKRRVAYLETYTPELAKILRDIQAARKAHIKYEGKAPGGDDLFVLKNTLVRRESETTWYDMTTPDARVIVGEWQRQQGPGGETPVACTP